MPANERSHDDQPVATARQRRRRLLVHAVGFSAAGLLSTVVSLPSTSAAPTVQTGRYLSGGSVSVPYTCAGADQATIDLLAALGSGTFNMPVTITSAAVDPSPSPTEAFDMTFTWDFTIEPALIATALGVGVTAFDISAGVDTMTATTGATGSVVGNAAAVNLPLGDGSVAVGYTDGPFTGSFTRTALADEPIVFTPGTITSTVTAQPLGVGLNITCANAASTMTVTDQDGVAPSTTTTTRPVVTTVAPTTTAAVLGTNQSLPRTGSSSSLPLVVLALGLLDLGYLSRSAVRRRQASLTG